MHVKVTPVHPVRDGQKSLSTVCVHCWPPVLRSSAHEQSEKTAAMRGKRAWLVSSCLGWASLAMETLIQFCKQLQQRSFQGQVLHWRPKKGQRTRGELGSPSRSAVWCLDSCVLGGTLPGHLATKLPDTKCLC